MLLALLIRQFHHPLSPHGTMNTEYSLLSFYSFLCYYAALVLVLQNSLNDQMPMYGIMLCVPLTLGKIITCILLYDKSTSHKTDVDLEVEC